MKNIFISIIMLITLSTKSVEINYNDTLDYVPNEETAKKIAEAIWIPIYGENIKKLKPYKAYLEENKTVWVVMGTLPKGKLGGVPYIKINKKDCRILKVTHGK
jgi:hypothetical protein